MKKLVMFFALFIVIVFSSCIDSVKPVLTEAKPSMETLIAGKKAIEKVTTVLQDTKMLQEYFTLKKESKEMVLTAHRLKVEGEISEEEYQILKRDYKNSKEQFDDLFIQIAKDLTRQSARQELLSTPQTFTGIWLGDFKDAVSFHNANFVANYEQVTEQASGFLTIVTTVFKIVKVVLEVTGLDTHLENLAVDKFRQHLLDKWSLTPWEQIVAGA